MLLLVFVVFDLLVHLIYPNWIHSSPSLPASATLILLARYGLLHLSTTAAASHQYRDESHRYGNCPASHTPALLPWSGRTAHRTSNYQSIGKNVSIGVEIYRTYEWMALSENLSVCRYPLECRVVLDEFLDEWGGRLRLPVLVVA